VYSHWCLTDRRDRNDATTGEPHFSFVICASRRRVALLAIALPVLCASLSSDRDCLLVDPAATCACVIVSSSLEAMELMGTDTATL